MVTVATLLACSGAGHIKKKKTENFRALTLDTRWNVSHVQPPLKKTFSVQGFLLVRGALLWCLKG